MKLSVVRGITYGVIGVGALVAMQVSPPDYKKPTVLDSALSAQLPLFEADVVDESGVPTYQAGAVVINAARLNGVDTLVLGGTIRSSLYNALNEIGATEVPRQQRLALAWHLADIFDHKVDMSRDLRAGDRFVVMVERLQQPSGRVIISKILGAKLALSGEDHEAIYFKSKESNSEWFDSQGKSLTAAFLRAPLEYRRISSSFGGRRHPVLNTWRRHEGTDYAAPTGTPVRAIGDGVVVSAGWKGGYGNAVDIRHSNGYVSRYGHLSRFGSGLRAGTRVKMGSTIGYVGMTGLATGPHLHFEIRVNGVARDPGTALRNKSGSPLPASELELFNDTRSHTLAALAQADSGATERYASAVIR